MSVTSEERPVSAGLDKAAEARSARSGLLNGLGAYAIWGFIPLYFHALTHVSPWIILCHRIVWSALFLGIVVSSLGEWRTLWLVVTDRRRMLFLAAGAVLIAANWLIFIHAVATRQLLQASLGYFINPVLSVALGVFFLRERLRGWQWLAVLIACAAVANLAVRGVGVPWIAISLAGTFGFYGLIRKKLDIHSLHGLLVETVVLMPVAVVILLLPTHTKGSLPTLGLLSLSGVLTAVPLLMFGTAVRRLKLSTMGFLQYLGPTLQFLVALVLFGEPLDRAKLASFVLSWLAIAVYVADSILTRHPPEAVADEPE